MIQERESSAADLSAFRREGFERRVRHQILQLRFTRFAEIKRKICKGADTRDLCERCFQLLGRTPVDHDPFDPLKHRLAANPDDPWRKAGSTDSIETYSHLLARRNVLYG